MALTDRIREINKVDSVELESAIADMNDMLKICPASVYKQRKRRAIRSG